MGMLRWTHKFLSLTGLRRLRKFTLARRTYQFLYSRFVPSRDIVLVDTPGGKAYTNIGQIGGVGRELAFFRVYEKGETELFKRVVREGMTVVDLGANIGYYTLLAAKLVGDKGRVFAFEPTPNNFDLLVKNIEVNGYKNIVAQQKAVSNRNGTTKLFLYPGDPNASNIYDSCSGRDSIMVGVTSLDSFWQSEGCPPIDVIKMDIEGGEMAALEGMTEIISRNDNLRIMTEFFPEDLQRAGVAPLDFLNKFIECGFKLYAITSKEPWIKSVDVDKVMEMVENAENKNLKFTNLFCQKSL